MVFSTYDSHISQVFKDISYESQLSVTPGISTPRCTLIRQVEVCEYKGRRDGPAFATPYGCLASSPDYNAIFRKYSKVVQEETDLIKRDHDVDLFYSTFQTPRKTSTTRVEQAGFGHRFVDQMNRWRMQEILEGRAPR
jgi:hypothetical protein